MSKTELNRDRLPPGADFVPAPNALARPPSKHRMQTRWSAGIECLVLI